MNFREATGHRIDWVDTGISTGFSNFLFVDKQYASNPVLRRIFSLARKLDFKSLLIEEIKETDCALLSEEDTALHTRHTDFEKSIVHRISFFRSPKKQQPSHDDFLGYAIFKKDFFSGKHRGHVFESVMTPFRREEQNNFIHCRREYTVNTELGRFKVCGVLYAQQNDATFVCAHVSLRSALSCILPEADITYSRLNALAGIDHKTRKMGEGIGITPEDIESILKGCGISFQKIVHEPKEEIELPTEFQRDLYGFIESGFPALVGFELDHHDSGTLEAPRHLIPVIGHTFNEDTWVPDAQRAYFANKLGYFSSESWLSAYVIHDDNFGPYYCLPRHFLKKDNFRIIFGLKPFSTPSSALESEAVGFDFLQAITNHIPAINQDWYDRFSLFTKHSLLVLRTLLVPKSQYLDHLKQMRSWEGVSLESSFVEKFTTNLPDFFWLVEASAPELFSSSRRKFGEVLLDATKPFPRTLDLSPLLSARFPGMLVFKNQGKTSIEETALKGHTPLFQLAQNFLDCKPLTP